LKFKGLRWSSQYLGDDNIGDGRNIAELRVTDGGGIRSALFAAVVGELDCPLSVVVAMEFADDRGEKRGGIDDVCCECASRAA
jgi:hypothetical protein